MHPPKFERDEGCVVRAVEVVGEDWLGLAEVDVHYCPCCFAEEGEG